MKRSGIAAGELWSLGFVNSFNGNKMATVKEHYEQVLSDVYSWMAGGFNSGIERNIDFFKKHKITPLRSGMAIDLGAGKPHGTNRHLQPTHLAQL